MDHARAHDKMRLTAHHEELRSLRATAHEEPRSLAGQKLPPRIWTGKPSASQRNLPRRIERLKAIEHEVERQLGRLAQAYETTRSENAHPEEFARRWSQMAQSWVFYEVNDLIGEHNEWFPIEAKLRMDPRTGDYRGLFDMEYRKQPLDAAWILERFPAELSAAGGAGPDPVSG